MFSSILIITYLLVIGAHAAWINLQANCNHRHSIYLRLRADIYAEQGIKGRCLAVINSARAYMNAYGRINDCVRADVNTCRGINLRTRAKNNIADAKGEGMPPIKIRQRFALYSIFPMQPGNQART
jgi:hypothetical protein